MGNGNHFSKTGKAMLTKLQKEILLCCESNGGTIKTIQILGAFDSRIYSPNVIGNAVETLVKAKELRKDGRGVYSIGVGTKPVVEQNLLF